MRLIDLDEILNDIDQIQCSTCQIKSEMMCLSCAVDEIKEIAKASDIVRDCKTGHWIEDHSDTAKLTWCTCSNCGHKLVNYDFDEANSMYKYCRNCGAKMDEVSE